MLARMGEGARGTEDEDEGIAGHLEVPNWNIKFVEKAKPG